MTGYYIQRDSKNRIVGAFTQPQPGVAEEFYSGEPELFHSLTWTEVRARRNALLTQSDWTQLADAPLSSEKKAEWQVYRQALRDITETFEDANAIEWPVSP